MIFLRMARFLAILFLYSPALPCFVCSRSALLCLLALRLALSALALPCFACLRSALLCLLALCLALPACALPCFVCSRSALLCLRPVRPSPSGLVPPTASQRAPPILAMGGQGLPGSAVKASGIARRLCHLPLYHIPWHLPPLQYSTLPSSSLLNPALPSSSLPSSVLADARP